ncbi:hypothetical protein DER45DRAFT_632419 [Fusarium avenaceum]|nr:hypothetical protein DER45DRAFT_632419 [Fusarium avenaceum]
MSEKNPGRCSTDQIMVKKNSAAYLKYWLRPRVLVDVSKTDSATTLFGQSVPFPLCVSPAGIQAMAHPDGELATSRACAKRGVHMGVSSFSNYSVQDVRAAGLAVGPLHHVMQLYTMQDRSAQLRIIQRAEEAGCVAIFLTADSPVLGVRYNELRNDFRAPEGLALPMLEKTSETVRAQAHDDGFTSFNSDSHSWAKEIPWLRSVTKMQIWIKGVLTAEDLQLAVQYGCDGVIIDVHIDEGIRSGTDIFKALALGAKCVWIGRPITWGLAYHGEAGVTETLDILYNEFRRCMQLCGCKNIAEITPASLGVVSDNCPLARL